MEAIGVQGYNFRDDFDDFLSEEDRNKGADKQDDVSSSDSDEKVADVEKSVSLEPPAEIKTDYVKIITTKDL